VAREAFLKDKCGPRAKKFEHRCYKAKLLLQSQHLRIYRRVWIRRIHAARIKLYSPKTNCKSTRIIHIIFPRLIKLGRCRKR